MSLRVNVETWLNRSIGHRIRLFSVTTAISLVIVLGIASFPLFFYQAWQNHTEHKHNSLDRICDTFEFRLSATQQALGQLAKSSFIVNALVDSTGREVYLSPTLREFNLPIDLPVKLIMYDANMKPFAGNKADFASAGGMLQRVGETALQSQKVKLLEYSNQGHNEIAIPIYFPPASSYEGVLLAVVDAELLFKLPENYWDDNDCLTVKSGSDTLYNKGCEASIEAGKVSRVLINKQQNSDLDVSVHYFEKSNSLVLQLLLVFSVYVVIGVGAVIGTLVLSRRASSVFVEQLQSLSQASLLLAANPGAETRVKWKYPDEIGTFVDAFNTMVARLQTFQGSLESRIAERTNELQIILDNVVDGIVTIDEQGIILTFNRAAETIFGYEGKEVIGLNSQILLPESERNEYDDYFKKYKVTEQNKIIGSGRELLGRHKDGRVFPMDLAVSRSIDHNQPLFIGLIRDITERKRIDQMKNEFVSTVSHELRTPLTSINGAIGLLAGGVLGEMPTQAKVMIDVAYKNSQRLSLLINDLLDMEKLVSGKIELELKSQPLIPLVEQALESIRAYGEQYQVTFDIASRVEVDVKVDAARLIQVLNNFLSNAAKFSEHGGQVEVVIRPINNVVRVEVFDHGAGIPASFYDRIFQKFSQADSSDTRQKGGTGLGLAISKELIERMGGEIGFESEEGQGSCFYFDLPL